MKKSPRDQSPILIDSVVDTEDYSYVGQVCTGTKTRQGHGSCTWKSPDRSGYEYKGGWKDDTRSGQGVFSTPDFFRYEGEWQDDTKSGQGVHTCPAGDRYEGGFEDDETAGPHPALGCNMSVLFAGLPALAERVHWHRQPAVSWRLGY